MSSFRGTWYRCGVNDEQRIRKAITIAIVGITKRIIPGSVGLSGLLPAPGNNVE